MANPYEDRMNAIARLRVQKIAVEQQIGDETAKAWRLAPVQDLASFAQNLGATPADVRRELETRGIRVPGDLGVTE